MVSFVRWAITAGTHHHFPLERSLSWRGKRAEAHFPSADLCGALTLFWLSPVILIHMLQQVLHLPVAQQSKAEGD